MGFILLDCKEMFGKYEDLWLIKILILKDIRVVSPPMQQSSISPSLYKIRMNINAF